MGNVIPGATTATLAALCALAVGVAIRRGASCAVAAVNEIIDERKCGRLLAILTAFMLVPGGLFIAKSLDALPSLPAGAPVTHAAVLGGLLLGLGASVNGACAFGTIARIGAGQWSYVATPIGYYAGCHIAARGLAIAIPFPVHDSPALYAPASIVVLLGVISAMLAACALHSRHAGSTTGMRCANPDDGHRVSWLPRGATAAIGITFVLLFVLDSVGTSADTLADLAQGRPGGATASRGLLFGALIVGAMSALIKRAMRGEHASGTRVTPSQLVRCLTGGALMGWASLMIPGGNDALVLLAMPLLRPYAWVAFAATGFAIGAASLSRRLLCVRRQRKMTELA
ncbi:YeeE/YedE thiosulfate transporter family protein [Paraburkholderia rhizosphaerae]|uniref:Toxin CptA n=1 Tax=Paraburkholderia rhizosphaerae TaxID=480658 RepID=A0A4R8LHL8_9BURK|nr:YeeE/YedE thiosulfate transporter family protein [Paraburkholderia rhizosphaerae]TDY42713.1 toxin CptA [Paraburkholderia rhizosphaerae]